MRFPFITMKLKWVTDKIVEKYAASARTISLRLSAFCNTNLPYDEMIDGVYDSKRVSAKKREKLYDEICEKSIDYSIAYATVEEIDNINIFIITIQKAENFTDMTLLPISNPIYIIVTVINQLCLKTIMPIIWM